MIQPQLARLFLVLVFGAQIFFFSVGANAQTTHNYIGPDDGLWSNASNWDSGAIPDSSIDSAQIVGDNLALYDLPNGQLGELLVGNSSFRGSLGMMDDTRLTVSSVQLFQGSIGVGSNSAEMTIGGTLRIGESAENGGTWFGVFNGGYASSNSVVAGASTIGPLGLRGLAVHDTGSRFYCSGMISTREWGTVGVLDGGHLDADSIWISNLAGTTTGSLVVRDGSQVVTTGSIHIGQLGRGLVEIRNAFVQSGDARFGVAENSLGYGTIRNSTWTGATNFHVGQHGDSHLRIIFGSHVTNTYGYIGSGNGSGTVWVENNSTWENQNSLYIGAEGGTGTLNIENGGQVFSSTGFVGQINGGSGTVNVSGAGSKWTNSSNFFVGFDADGTVSITDGGVVQTGYTEIGRIANRSGEILVDGAGSKLDVTGNPIIVGQNGNASLHIQNGGQVVSGVSVVAIGSGEGEVDITGTNSVWQNSSSLFVAGYTSASQGTGIVRVSNNGRLSIADTLQIWDNGALEIDGGHIDATNLILVPNAEFQMTGGSLVLDELIADSVQVDGGLISVDEMSAFTDGEVIQFVQTDGILAPGQSPGSTLINGDYFLDGGVIDLELAGLIAGTEHDFISTTGDFTINSGVLDVSLIDGFVLNAGDEFFVFDIGGIQSGYFDGLGQDSLVGSFGGIDLFIDYTAGDGNDIRLYTIAIPEPSSSIVFVLAGVVFFRCRRVSKRTFS